jgi:hypothetical protein
MRLTGMVAVGLLVMGGVARGDEGAATPGVEVQPPATTAPPAAVSQSGAATPAATLTPPGAEAPPGAVVPPENVYAEPSTPASAELASRAATAEMKGNPQESLRLSDEAIRADAKDPWPYYDKGMALARVGETNGALAALLAAEQHFSPTDRWGRSVAVFGRAHTLAGAGRCDEARQAFQEYMSLVRGDPDAVGLAQRYSRDCRPPAPTKPAAPPSK